MEKGNRGDDAENRGSIKSSCFQSAKRERENEEEKILSMQTMRPMLCEFDFGSVLV